MKKLFVVLVFFVIFAVSASAQLTCSSSAECDDSNPKTLDYCQRSGADNSGCSNLSCVVACSTDGECGDGDDATTDVCSGAGRCSAVCSHLALCGNGTVDVGETSCNCPEDA